MAMGKRSGSRHQALGFRLLVWRREESKCRTLDLYSPRERGSSFTRDDKEGGARNSLLDYALGFRRQALGFRRGANLQRVSPILFLCRAFRDSSHAAPPL